MARYKKYGLGLLIGLLLFPVLLGLFPKKALAAAAASNDEVNKLISTLHFVDAATIFGTLDNGQAIIFNLNDQNMTNNAVYQAQNYDCDATITLPVSQFSLYHGVNTFTSSSKATADIDFKNPQNKCTGTTPKNKIQTPIGDPALARAYYAQTSPTTIGTTISFDGGNNYITGSFSYTLGEDGLYHKDEEDGVQCQDVAIVSGGNITVFEIDSQTSTDSSTNNQPVTPAMGIGNTDCYIVRINGIHPDNPQEAASLAKQPISLASPESPTVSGGVDGETPGEEQKTVCGEIKPLGLEWALCPVIKGLDAIVFELNETITKLLSFDVDKYLTTDIHRSWGVMKDVATSLLVIAMLAMVISQAVSWGPFDAYTVRKILPRLVAAVILMQISWELFKWTIEVANHAGQGIQAIMFEALPGKDLTLNAAIGSLGGNTINITALGLFGGLTVFAATSGLTVAGIGLLALAASLSVLIAVLVLFIRQILIILCMIFVPVAIAAWILPGTSKYWKLWHETFSKLLLMFPLIIALIAAGKIFANLASGMDGILAVFAVLIGFFGPYWLIPKTFQWGGRALGNLAGVVNDRSKGIIDRPRKYAMEQANINKEQRALDRANRLATTQPGNRRLRDRLFAGEFNIARSRSARERGFNRTLAEGERQAREGVAAHLLSSGFENMRHAPPVDATSGEQILRGEAGYENNKLDALQSWLEGEEYAGITPDEALMGHSFDELARLGDPDRIRAARRNSRGHEAVWSKALARNFGRMNEIARDFTLAPDLTKLSERQFTTQDATTIQELFNQVEKGYVMDRETGQQKDLHGQERIDQWNRGVALATTISGNDLIRMDLTPQHKEVLAQLVSLGDQNPAKVSVRQEPGKDPVVVLPRSDMLELTDTRGSLTQELSTSSPRSQAVATEFARQLDDPKNADGYQKFLREGIQAQVGTSPEAANMNAELSRAYRSHLDQQVQKHEQELLAQGRPPANAQTEAQAFRKQLDQRYQALFP